MIKNRIEIRTLILATLLVGMVLIPAVNAQEENKYSVTAEEAFKHANAHMITYIATDAPYFENWEGASIDPNPLELYDPNGQKLYYQFSVYKNDNLIGVIDIGADKKLGQTVQLVEFDPKPFDATKAIKKSIEVAKNEYPDGKIKSTYMVVYDYPLIGAVTVVKDKVTGDEHRIFVDAYTLDVVPDEPATETKRGIWSIYEQRLKNGVDENLKVWQESDDLTKSIEQKATSMKINISVPVTDKHMEKLINEETIKATAVTKTLSISLSAQENNYYCAPATAKMIAKYYGKTQTQDYIYGIMGATAPSGASQSQQLTYYKSSQGLGKTNSKSVTTPLTFTTAQTEIDNGTPFKSGITGHARACIGYYYTTGNYNLIINDPSPVGVGRYAAMEPTGSEINRIYLRS
ncbi:MAG TPA: C39 family peptidase [Methanosarcina sp.]|nr:C39 family peptidase [Methanosarcina sp.]